MRTIASRLVQTISDLTVETIAVLVRVVLADVARSRPAPNTVLRQAGEPASVVGTTWRTRCSWNQLDASRVTSSSVPGSSNR